ncbi:MAG: hypothetical protein ACRYG7_24580 [Janthinobacterium lividum]
MNASKIDSNRITAVLLMGIYAVWWGYVLYFLYAKEYDNNYAAAVATEGIVLLTIIALITYTIAFFFEARRKAENRKFYLRAILLLFVPIGGIFFFEAARALLA